MNLPATIGSMPDVKIIAATIGVAPIPQRVTIGIKLDATTVAAAIPDARIPTLVISGILPVVIMAVAPTLAASIGAHATIMKQQHAAMEVASIPDAQ